MFMFLSQDIASNHVGIVQRHFHSKITVKTTDSHNKNVSIFKYHVLNHFHYAYEY